MPLAETNDPLFILDDSLNRKVAKALLCVDYNITSVQDAFDGRARVLDPEIIHWCKTTDAVWITGDIAARKQHKRELQTSSIRALWVYRRKGGMSTKEQLRVLSFVLPDLINRFCLNSNQLHYRARVHGLPPKERITLEEISLLNYLK